MVSTSISSMPSLASLCLTFLSLCVAATTTRRSDWQDGESTCQALVDGCLSEHTSLLQESLHLVSRKEGVATLTPEQHVSGATHKKWKTQMRLWKWKLGAPLAAFSARASALQTNAHDSEDLDASLQKKKGLQSGPGGIATCITNAADAPAAWARPASFQTDMATFASVGDESLAADDAARSAFQELVAFFQKKRPESIKQLGLDALEPIINGAFAGSNMQDVQNLGLYLGRDMLLQMAGPLISRSAKPFSCAAFRDAPDAPTLVQYGRYLQTRMPQNDSMDATQARLEDVVNNALATCSSLEDLLGFDPRRRLSKYPDSSAVMSPRWIDKMFKMTLQAVDVLGLLANPNLKMPEGALNYVASFWAYLFKYPFPAAADYPGGAKDWRFEQNSFVVTHIAYVVTGYQRYALHEGDAPWLFQYLRENFYAALESSLDLGAEFLDNLRQLGCTSGNDAQTSDGTRVLLQKFQDAGGSWINYREPDEVEVHGEWFMGGRNGQRLTAYDFMHKAWTAYVGLHGRVPETDPPGTSYSQMAKKAVELAFKKVNARAKASANEAAPWFP